jgi:hypothetical protein
MYAIEPCAIENVDREYKNGNVCIFSDSQPVIKELEFYQINSKLV